VNLLSLPAALLLSALLLPGGAHAAELEAWVDDFDRAAYAWCRTLNLPQDGGGPGRIRLDPFRAQPEGAAPFYLLRVLVRTPAPLGLAPGETLTLVVDGERLALYGGPLAPGAPGDQVFSVEVGPGLLRALAVAREVRARVTGRRGSVTATATERNVADWLQCRDSLLPPPEAPGLPL
jgi:hypothetical protein